jgi:hypothetical protein
MSNQGFLERAFALADSGTVQNVKDIRSTQLTEGYTYFEVDQISGTTLSKQLTVKIQGRKPSP